MASDTFSSFSIYAVNGNGSLTYCQINEISSSGGRWTSGRGHVMGFRPIFLLKSNIYVEKIVDSEDFTGNGGFYNYSEDLS